MSKYKILRIDLPDPLSLSRRRKLMIYAFSALALVTSALIPLLSQKFTLDIGASILIVLMLFGGLFLVFILKLKSENKKYVTIGDIEFTKTSIIKRIGDLHSETTYGTIKSIELHKHIPAFTVFESKSGFYTYIISIIYKDSKKDNLIVSDRSLDKIRDISITETIKTLRNIINTEINIS
jgi:hypothetical protein